MNIVWLHGFPLGPGMWDAQLARYGGIAPAVVTPEAESVDAMADLALAAADDAGYDQFSLVGLSMGGYVAFRIMARAAHRVDSLVLADTRADADAPDMNAKRAKLIDDIRARGPQAALAFVDTVLEGRDDPEIRRRTRAMTLEREPDSLIAAVRALAGRPDSRAGLHKIRCPTLVVVGEEDAITPPELARVIEEGIPRSRLVEIAGAGHFSNLDRPDEFGRHVGSFLEAAVAAPQGW